MEEDICILCGRLSDTEICIMHETGGDAEVFLYQLSEAVRDYSHERLAHPWWKFSEGIEVWKARDKMFKLVHDIDSFAALRIIKKRRK